jgi:hypothetical protein
MSSCPIVTFCNKRAGWLAPPQHPWASAFITSLPRVHACSRCSFGSRAGRTQPALTKSMKSLSFSRCSPACPAPREQPSVSAPSRKGFAGRWSRRRPTAPRAAQIPEIGNPHRRPTGPTARNRPRREDRPTARNHTPTPARPTARNEPRRPTASNHDRSLTGLTARYRNRRLGRAGGPGGRPPGPAPRTAGKLAEGERTARTIAWARRDLNPHVLSDTRT